MSKGLYTILIVDDDPLVAEGVAMTLVEPGRRVIICHDIATGSMVVDQDDVDVVIADIRFGNDFSYEGLDFIDTVRRESPQAQVIVMSGAGSEGLKDEALRRGASGYLSKPFPSSELEELLRRGPGFGDNSAIIHVPHLDSVLDGEMLHVNFQPIIALDERRVIGFEALARIRTESLLRNPENLFNYASREGRIPDLEARCLTGAIHSGKSLAEHARLFLNVHPCSFEQPEIVRVVTTALESAGIAPERVVLEITEQGAIRSRASLDQIRALRNLGVSFALDDIGVAFSHLPYIDQIEPEWIKISQLFGTGFEKEPTKVKIVRNLADLAISFNAKLILEGVETEDTAAAAADTGIEYAQGYLFARPQPVEQWNSLAWAS